MGSDQVTAQTPAAGSGELAENERPAGDAPGDGVVPAGNGVIAKRAAGASGARATHNGHGVSTVELVALGGGADRDGLATRPLPAAEPATEGARRRQAPAGAIEWAERKLASRQAKVRSLERERLRTAKSAAGALRERRRAAKQATMLRRRSPAARRAELVATAVSLAAAAAEPVPEPAPPRRLGTFVRRTAALVAVLVIPGCVWALLTIDAGAPEVARADAAFIGAELIKADQRVRAQLARLRPLRIAAARARTRDAVATTTSLAIELRRTSGARAERLQRALRLERRWLEAVGSTLRNPRSPLRDELVARDAALRPALDALAGPARRRAGGSQQLVDYATSRAH